MQHSITFAAVQHTISPSSVYPDAASCSRSSNAVIPAKKKLVKRALLVERSP
jgi:hypothetical protein